MAVTDSDSLSGSLEIVGRPRAIKWSTPLEFIKFLTEIFRVKFPVNPGNKFIVTGPASPSPDDQFSLWAKSDKSGNPQGWWSFVRGQWRRFYTPIPGEIAWVYGDSTKPPDGWQFIDESIPGFPAGFVAQLKRQYYENPVSAGNYIYFAVRYIGY